MGRILIKQGDKYIPSTDEDVKGMSEPMGRGSDSLKKRLVKVGMRDGLPVYELRSLTEAPMEPTPAPLGPKPTPGPMSVQPSDRDPTRDYLAPYRSQTPIPEFNLGITGATSTVPAKVADRPRGYQDPVAKAKAQTQAAKAKTKGAIRAPLKPKEFVGPMDPTPDAKRRWEEWYLRADAPKPEPLDLSLPPEPNINKAPEAKADPLAKYQVPDALGDLGVESPAPKAPSTEPVDGVTPVGADGDLQGDLGEAGGGMFGKRQFNEGVDGVTPVGADGDLQGDLDEAGGGMFGKRQFNEGMGGGETPAPTEPPKGLDKYRRGDVGTPITGRGTPMETNDTETTSTQTTGVVDQELLEKAKGGIDTSTARQEKALSDLENTINEQRGVDEKARGALATQRQGLLERYTQGLDAASRARFMDTLVKNVGKIVAGGVGLHKGIDVASNYKYEGADTEGMRKDVDSAYAANLANLEAQEKERKGVSDKEFEMRKQFLDATIKLPAAQQDMLLNVLNLQKVVMQDGKSAQTAGWSDAKIDFYLEDIARKAEEAEKAGKFKERELWTRYQEILASIKNTELRSRAAVDVSKNQAKASVENKGKTEVEQGKKEETQTRPEDVIAQRNALSEALAHLKKMKITDKAFADAMNQGRTQEAISLFTAKLDSLVVRAEQDKNESLASRLVLARSTLEQMAPFITSTKQLETLVQTFNTLVKNPETELGANIRGTTQSQSSGEKQTQESTTRIQGPAKNLPDVKKEPTDEGVQGPAKAPPGVKKELTDEEVRKLRKVMEGSPNPEFRKRAEQMLREHNFQQY